VYIVLNLFIVPGRRQDSTLKLVHNYYLLLPFQFIIC